jgi:hypothetical protein
MSEEDPTDAEIARLAGFLQVFPASGPDRRAPALAREVLRLRADLVKLRASAEQMRAEVLVELGKIEASAKKLEPIEADARRFRWLLAGNGYFLEEAGLCGRPSASQEEQDRARAEIDEAMRDRSTDS